MIKSLTPNQRIYAPGRQIVKPQWPFSVNYSAPIADRIEAIWPMEPSGTFSVPDLLGNKPATYSNGSFTDWEPYRDMNMGIGFAVGGNREIRTNAATFPFHENISAIVWLVRSTGLGGGFRGIMAHADGDATPDDWYLYFDNDNKLHIDIPFVLGDVVIGNTVVAEVTEIHCVGLTRSGTTGNWDWILYLDGAADGSTLGSASNPETSTKPYTIGNLNTTSGHICQCIIFYAALWTRTLSAAEMWQLWAPQTRWDILSTSYGVPLTLLAPAAVPGGIPPIMNSYRRRRSAA